MNIQIDSREKAHAIQKIIETFNQNGVKWVVSKLMAGDYMSFDNARLVIDRKQNLSELVNNIIQDHKRFVAELERCKEMNIKIIILVEHGGSIKTLQDVIWWKNPRSEKRVRGEDGKWHTEKVEYTREVKPKWKRPYTIKCHPTTGLELYKKLCTMQEKYNVEFQFCDKRQTGKKIIEILKGE